MPVFDWAESPSSSHAPVASVLATRFGDGYEQRAPDGLNPVRQVWDLVFNACDVVVANEIDAFLRPILGGIGTFDWTPPAQTVALKFKCSSFRRSLTQQLGEHNLSATFEQVFEP